MGGQFVRVNWRSFACAEYGVLGLRKVCVFSVEYYLDCLWHSSSDFFAVGDAGQLYVEVPVRALPMDSRSYLINIELYRDKLEALGWSGEECLTS